MTAHKITGTSKAYLLKRLKADFPELHQQVLTGKLSAHAAAVQAGIRTQPIQISKNIPLAARRIKEYFGLEQLQELLDALQQN